MWDKNNKIIEIQMELFIIQVRMPICDICQIWDICDWALCNICPAVFEKSGFSI